MDLHFLLIIINSCNLGLVMGLLVLVSSVYTSKINLLI